LGAAQYRINLLRSTAPDYLAAQEYYLSNVLRPIEAAQITHGGPVIILQYENEYSISDTPETIDNLTQLFVLGQALTPSSAHELSTELHAEYMESVRNVFEEAEIVVPQMANDAVPAGNWAPGSGEGAADIYAIDDYPFPYRLSCEFIYLLGHNCLAMLTDTPGRRQYLALGTWILPSDSLQLHCPRGAQLYLSQDMRLQTSSGK
jgi:hypothetical protein